MAEDVKKYISQLNIGGVAYDIKDAEARAQIELLATGGVRYVGKTETELTDGGVQIPVIEGKNSYAPLQGDLVIYINGDEPDIEFIWNGSSWDMFGNHGELGELAYKDQVSGQLNWAHNHEFELEDADISVSGATVGVAVADINYKPEGSIGVGSGAVNYIPAGSVTLGGEQEKDVVISGNVADKVVDAHDYTPAGTVAITTADNADGNYTPKGTINKLNFNGSQATLEHEDHNHAATFAGKAASISAHSVTQGTVSGDIAAAFDGTEATLEVKGNVSVNAGVTTGKITYVTGHDLVKATNDDVVTSYANEVLTLDFTSLVKGDNAQTTEATFVTGLNPTATFTGEDIVYKPAGTVTGTFSGVTAGVGVADHDQITPEGTVTVQQAKVGAHTYTPAGEIDQPIFTGTRAMIGATFAGTQASLEHAAHNHAVGTLKGSVQIPTSATFAGTGVDLIFNGKQATLQHEVTQGTVSASGTYKKLKAISQKGQNDTIICK